jgi:hypothetical protein
VSLRVGHASRDITPRPGITLSGFVARCNRPSTGVDDPLRVHALAVQKDAEPGALLLVFDLLGLGPEMHRLLHAALDRRVGATAPAGRRIFVATHTHSAPAVVRLLGCGIPEHAYWRKVVGAAAAAAEEALGALRPAVFRAVTVPVRNASYNRRRVLADGRVVMAQFPDAPVRRSGPGWDRMLLARFDAPDGRGIVGFALGAIHADTVCTSRVTGDFPGRLRRGLSVTHGFPFFYLQGACADLNPPLGNMDRRQMLANSRAILAQLRAVRWPARGVGASAGPVRAALRLAYGRLPAPAALAKTRRGMERVARTGSGPTDTLELLANILNVKPGEWPDPATARHTAGALAEWAGRPLARGRGRSRPTCELGVGAWRFGRCVLVFVAAEAFVATALSLRRAFPGRCLDVVGYASPLIGYLPPDTALAEGGYEADFAYRFYGHPAPFARGSERAFLCAARKAVRAVL